MTIGKGGMIWKLRNFKGGDIARQQAEVQRLGLNWVSPKIVDGTDLRWEGNYPRQNADYLPEFVPAMREIGVAVRGWGWTYGRSRRFPHREIAEAEADAFAVAMRLYKITDFEIDAESDYKRIGFNMVSVARRFMNRLRLNVPNATLGLCSFRFPEYHANFPWRAFLALCDLHAPQVYFVENYTNEAGARQLVKSHSQLRAIKPLPMLPIGPTFLWERRTSIGKKIKWRPTLAQLLRFFQQARDMNLFGVGVWALEQANTTELEALKAFSWGPITPPPPAPSVKAWAHDADDFIRGMGYAGPRPPS